MGQLVLLRAECARHLRSLSPEVIGDVQLVVTELAANVVQHTPLHTGRVVVWQEPGDVHVAVSDRSSTLPSVPRDSSSGGRGMRIVDVLAHAWGVEHVPSGKTVWAEISIPS